MTTSGTVFAFLSFFIFFLQLCIQECFILSDGWTAGSGCQMYRKYCGRCFRPCPSAGQEAGELGCDMWPQASLEGRPQPRTCPAKTGPGGLQGHAGPGDWGWRGEWARSMVSLTPGGSSKAWSPAVVGWVLPWPPESCYPAVAGGRERHMSPGEQGGTCSCTQVGLGDGGGPPSGGPGLRGAHRGKPRGVRASVPCWSAGQAGWGRASGTLMTGSGRELPTSAAADSGQCARGPWRGPGVPWRARGQGAGLGCRVVGGWLCTSSPGL